MKRFLLLALLALAPLALPAQPAPKPITLPAGIRMEKDLAYIPDGDPAQKLDQVEDEDEGQQRQEHAAEPVEELLTDIGGEGA